jgi:hypothetical protein
MGDYIRRMVKWGRFMTASLSAPMRLTQHIAHASHGGQQDSSCDKPLDEGAGIHFSHVLWGPYRRAITATETFIVDHHFVQGP